MGRGGSGLGIVPDSAEERVGPGVVAGLEEDRPRAESEAGRLLGAAERPGPVGPRGDKPAGAGVRLAESQGRVAEQIPRLGLGMGEGVGRRRAGEVVHRQPRLGAIRGAKRAGAGEGVDLGLGPVRARGRVATLLEADGQGHRVPRDPVEARRVDRLDGVVIPPLAAEDARPDLGHRGGRRGRLELGRGVELLIRPVEVAEPREDLGAEEAGESLDGRLGRHRIERGEGFLQPSSSGGRCVRVEDRPVGQRLRQAKSRRF